MTPDKLKAVRRMCDEGGVQPWRKELTAALEFIVALMWDKFYGAAHIVERGENAGWYDSCCHSDACEAADYLIPLGLVEEKSGSIGRRRFYRPIEQEKPSG